MEAQEAAGEAEGPTSLGSKRGKMRMPNPIRSAEALARQRLEEPLASAALAAIAVALAALLALVGAGLKGDADLREAAARASAATPALATTPSTASAGPAVAGSGTIACEDGGAWLAATGQGVLALEPDGAIRLACDAPACSLSQVGDELLYLDRASFDGRGRLCASRACSMAIASAGTTGATVLYEAPPGRALYGLVAFEGWAYVLECSQQGGSIVVKAMSLDRTGEPSTLLEGPFADAWLMADVDGPLVASNVDASSWKLWRLGQGGPSAISEALSGSGTLRCAAWAEGRLYYGLAGQQGGAHLQWRSLGGSFADFADAPRVERLAANKGAIAFADASGKVGWLDSATGIAHDLTPALAAAGYDPSTSCALALMGSQVLVRTSYQAFVIDLSTASASRLAVAP